MNSRLAAPGLSATQFRLISSSAHLKCVGSPSEASDESMWNGASGRVEKLLLADEFGPKFLSRKLKAFTLASMLILMAADGLPSPLLLSRSF